MPMAVMNSAVSKLVFIIGVDSPSATSAVTYQLQAASSSGATGVNRDVNNADRAEDPATTSHITVMEIQG